MKIGYARVSASDQILAIQQDALKAAGCTRTFTDDGASGARQGRRGPDKALFVLPRADTVVVGSLGCLGRALVAKRESLRAVARALGVEKPALYRYVQGGQLVEVR